MSVRCPCGLTGNNCTVFDDQLTEYGVPMDTLCNEQGLEKCLIQYDIADCVCRCGWTGQYCFTEIHPLRWLIGVSIWLAASIFIFSVVFVRREQLKLRNIKVLTDFNLRKTDLVTSEFSFISPMFILIYRVTISLLGVSVQIYLLVTFGGTYLEYFTNWNWVLLTIFFLIGSYLSFRYVVLYKQSYGDITEYELTFLEKVFYVFLEVELPTTLLICVVVWALIFPASKRTDDEDDLVAFGSIIQHGVNVLLMLIEFWLSKVYIQLFHFWFVMIWAAIYFLFHGIYMLVRYLLGLEHCPVYDFFSLDSPILFLWILALFFFYFVFYVICFGISLVKMQLVSTFKGSKAAQRILEGR